MRDPFVADARAGAVVGALVGDAAGATLEFARIKITGAVAEAAMRMPGGGALDVGPGQITDDGELTLALAAALASTGTVPVYDADAVARAYSAWFRSYPFDCGGTCGRAFGFLSDATPAESMRANALKYSTLSEANGALMRATPIAARFHRLPPHEIGDIARADARMSHPSQACQDVNAMYCVAVAHLINHPRDAEGALAAAQLEAARCGDTARGWLEATQGLELGDVQCGPSIGHVKHAFTLAMLFLRQCAQHASAGAAFSSRELRAGGFEEAIKRTLLKGGDTDTNAAIVGGLMGALYGYDGIPSAMRDPVLAFDPVMAMGARVGHPRPAACRAASVLAILESWD
jgi:ADP-ribosylglycohydrolase